MMIRQSGFFLCLLLAAFKLDAQTKSEQFKFFNSWLPLAGMEFEMPRGYREVDVEFRRYYPERGNSLNSLLYNLGHSRKDIIIGVMVIPIVIPPDKDLRFRQRLSQAIHPERKITLEDVHPNNSWKKTMISHIDSVAGDFIPVDESMTMMINADTAVIFNLKMDRLYQGIYDKCKYVLIHKDNNGDGSILYFYRSGDERMVKREIKRTWGLLRFWEYDAIRQYPASTENAPPESEQN